MKTLLEQLKQQKLSAKDIECINWLVNELEITHVRDCDLYEMYCGEVDKPSKKAWNNMVNAIKQLVQ